jgi:hypothetical protein
VIDDGSSEQLLETRGLVHIRMFGPTAPDAANVPMQPVDVKFQVSMPSKRDALVVPAITPPASPVAHVPDTAEPVWSRVTLMPRRYGPPATRVAWNVPVQAPAMLAGGAGATGLLPQAVPAIRIRSAHTCLNMGIVSSRSDDPQPGGRESHPFSCWGRTDRLAGASWNKAE